MKQLVVICGEDKSRCGQILELLAGKRKGKINIIECVTTVPNEIFGYRVVTNDKFWNMVDQGDFFEYHVNQNIFYGTPHVDRKQANDQFMINNVYIAADIKKIYPKAVTIYVLPKEHKDVFETEAVNTDYTSARKLDFLVVDGELWATVKKIEEIVRFIDENGMRGR